MAESKRIAFVGTIECFTIGEDFNLYSERLEHFFALNKVDCDGEKVNILANFGGGDLYKIINKLVAPKKVKDFKYEELVKKLTDHFQPTRNVIAETFKFYKRNQQAESLSEYIIELKSIAENCDFGDFLDRALRDRFVCGISDEKIQQRLLNENKLGTFEKACDMALTMETTRNDLQMMHAGTANYVVTKKLPYRKNSWESSDSNRTVRYGQTMKSNSNRWNGNNWNSNNSNNNS